MLVGAAQWRKEYWKVFHVRKRYGQIQFSQHSHSAV